MSRNRILYLTAAILVIVLGLCTRRYAGYLPAFVADYAGDALWALTAFLGIGMIFPRWQTIQVAFTALLFAFVIEFSQLYHTPWIDEIRHTTLGHLILGQGFLWSDILCYIAGVGLGCTVETIVFKTVETPGGSDA